MYFSISSKTIRFLFDKRQNIVYNNCDTGIKNGSGGNILENRLRLHDLSMLICAPMLALLCSCAQPIEPPEDSTALLPDNVVESILTTTTSSTTATTTTTTTAMTIDPAWQENAIGNYNGNQGIVIQNVPHYTQFTSYLTACESLASVSVLQYYGINMDIDRFIDEYLPRAWYPEAGDDGMLHGESPWEYFIGDPRDGGGFGCYNTAIAKAINKIADGLAITLDHVSIDDLCKNYIDKGQPVIFWATINMQSPYVSQFKWYLPNGELYEFVNPEHALVLIGYDDNYYYFSDSMSHTDITPYSKAAVQTAYDGLFQQAVVIDPLVLETLPQSLRTPKEPVSNG